MPSRSPYFQYAWSRAGAKTTRDLSVKTAWEKTNPICLAKNRSSGNGHAGGDSFRNLSGKRPLDFFSFERFYRKDRELGAKRQGDSRRREGGRGEEVLNTTFLVGFVNRGGP